MVLYTKTFTKDQNVKKIHFLNLHILKINCILIPSQFDLLPWEHVTVDKTTVCLFTKNNIPFFYNII